MTAAQIKPIYMMILILFLSSVFTGCVSSTSPNTPYSKETSTELESLIRENRVLAEELCKIPEIQDGLSDEDKTALKRIHLLYSQRQNDFNAAFELMNDVGIPDVRRYCTPLQALYWLALDDKLKEFDISGYTLKGLLDQAWYKSGFAYDGKNRWDKFNEVTDRLNSPELLNYYESRNFTYRKITLRSENDHRNPLNIFRQKYGQCWLYTAFSVHCLKKSGYKAHAITVYHGNLKVPNHVACEYTDKDGKEYVMDNSIAIGMLSTGIYEKDAYLKTYPYYGKGYLSR